MGTKTIGLIIIILLIITIIPQMGIASEQNDTQEKDTNTLQQIQKAISDQNAEWVADYNTIFSEDYDYVSDFLGWNQMSSDGKDQQPPSRTTAAPASFDWRDVDGINYVTSVKNQASCGSCVGFAAIGALEAVVQIESETIFDCDLSESQLFFCGGGSCNRGWYPDAAAEFIETVGVVDELCFPYQSKDMDCDEKQSNWQSRLIKATHTGSVSENEHIKNALIEYGPLLTTFYVYEDFSSYRSGIYEHVWGQMVGGHAVVIVGYNDDPGYWICKNSWGTGWGEQGYFNIKYREVNIDDKVFFFDQITGNIQPTKPENILPEQGERSLETDITLRWDPCVDIDGNSVTYSIYLNEGYKIDLDEEPYVSGLTSTTYELNDLIKDTIYSWQVISEDSEGAQHSAGHRTFSTRMPSAPTVKGPTIAKIDTEYTYTASTQETDGNEYYWYFQWGDGESSGWLGPYLSSDEITISHTWVETGDYNLKVRYKEDGIESEWTTLQLTMSKTKSYDTMIHQLMQHFMFLFQWIQSFSALNV